jgi:diaminopropionate ammonia-lyase
VEIIENPLHGSGLPADAEVELTEIITDPAVAMTLFAQCPHAHTTPLVDAPELAQQCDIATLLVKDERQRMQLGSFKALGAAFHIAKQAASVLAQNPQQPVHRALSNMTFVCASAGNHGLSLAAGARTFGAEAVVYLSETVPESFAERLRGRGAQVVRAGRIYEHSMRAAEQAALVNDWQLLSDSSWIGYADPPRDVMEGYLIITAEIAEQISQPPTHIVIQAGVGGLAAAVAAAARHLWGDSPKIVVVEPTAAPALMRSIEQQQPVTTDGPISSMGRLDCKAPSHLALAYLARHANYFATVSDDAVNETLPLLEKAGLSTTSSGAAGISALLHGSQQLGLDSTSRALTYLTEAPS